MSVKKIFVILITVVACVLIGALVLNTLLPNVAAALVNAIEDMIFKATGMSFDFNADSNAGASNTRNTYNDTIGNENIGTGTVEGFN